MDLTTGNLAATEDNIARNSATVGVTDRWID